MIGRTLRKKLFNDLACHPVEQPEHAQAVLPLPRRFVRGGVKAGVLRNKANPNNPANVPSLRDADLAMTFTGNYAVLHALAENHGHVCIKVATDAPAGDLAVLELVTHVWAANGNVGAAVDATLADGRVELRELKQVRGAIYRTQQAMLAMLARLEEMAEPEKERAC